MKKYLLPVTLSLFLLSAFSLPSSVYAQVPTGGWPMVAGNPDRNSYSSDQLVGTPHVEWYRPIDAYIPPNFQVIAANDMVYVSSARGLYAMQYDTGAVVWRYDTEIPLGNSPTIATINGTSMAFVGGYDKKIHAFNALTGQHLWEFAGAKAGFDANPLVINNIVYVGNRDGYFYAINATNGQLVWQYPPANQDGIGPIHLSPAYKNNTIYFATDYNYGYALNTNGTLKWKSTKLRGDGYNNYWPVVYTNPADSKDYVIFSGKIPYREGMKPGTWSAPYNSDTYGMYINGLPSFPQNTTVNGVPMLDYAALTNFLNQNPHLRTYTVLDGTNGSETKIFPVLPQTNQNTQAPPVLNGGYLFIDNDRGNGRHHIMGWKFGTNYFIDTTLDGAWDEPLIMSSGGNNIYKILCCSRSGTYVSQPNLMSIEALWGYGGNSLAPIAPGYDEKLFYLYPGFLDNISAQYGNVNGVYGYHGNSNPIVPYKNKVFTIKGNSILAFGSGTARGKLSLLTSSAQTQNVSVPPDTELRSRLEKEIRKFDADQNGTLDILKPGYTDDSHFSNIHYLLDNYFDNPGDTLYTLSAAYPYLSSSLQAQVKNYLSGSNGIYDLYYKNGIIFRIGWARGAQRDSIPYPAGLAGDMANLPDDFDWNVDGTLPWSLSQYIHTNPNNFYALYKYVQNVALETTQAAYQVAYNKLTEGSCSWDECVAVTKWVDDATLREKPYLTNAYLAGYYGFLHLQELAGKTTTHSSLRTRVTNEYNLLKSLRLNNFSKDNPFGTGGTGYGQNFLTLSRNFIWLVPEVAAELRASKLAAVQQALDEYNTVGPYWFVSKFGAAVGESGQQNLYDYPSNFQARAWILKQPKEELIKYLDVPAFERGDLFYIQNLVALIEAPYAGATPTSSPVTPTPNPACQADVDNSGSVNGGDLVQILGKYGILGGSGALGEDLNGDNKVNILDTVWVVKYWNQQCSN